MHAARERGQGLVRVGALVVLAQAAAVLAVLVLLLAKRRAGGRESLPLSPNGSESLR